MKFDYYPPGHPTGIRNVTITITCAQCGTAYDVTGTHDEAVNYTNADSAQCPECGHFDGDPVNDSEEE